MGIARGTYRLLLKESKKKKFFGSILQLGKQDIFLSRKEIYKHAEKEKVSLKISNISDKKQVSDIEFFNLLGFNEVHSIDYSDYENADIIWDMNLPIPEEYHQKYDYIFDGGTSEHIFNFPRVLENISLMLKSGGSIIHLSPSHNHVDHGFYMFSPTVFMDFYNANDFDIKTPYIFEYSFSSPKRLWDVYEYGSGSLQSLSFGGFGKRLLGIFFVAQKKVHYNLIKTPQQFYYQNTWNKKEQKKSSFKQRISKHLPDPLKKKLKRILPKFIFQRKPKKVMKV